MKKIVVLVALSLFISCKKNQEKESKIPESTMEIRNEAKNLNEIENNIVTEYKKSETADESSEKFADFFYNEISDNKETLKFAFEKLQIDTQIRIASSENKKIRIYSWDNNSGGTMRFFDQIIQFEDNNKTSTILKVATDDAQGFVSKIFEVKNQANETFYLVLTNSVFSTSLSFQSLNAYKIADNKLIEAFIFKTKTSKIASINFEFDFFSVVDRPERPVELIFFENNTLKIPLIEKNGKVTDKFLIYKWDGNNFNFENTK